LTYAKGGILSEDPQEILIKTAFKHDCEGAEIFIKSLQIADIAWALALIKAGVIKNPEELIKVLVELNEFEINPAYGDIYNSKNIALKAFNKEVKNIHISRPRREAINVAFYLKLKDMCYFLHKEMKNLANAFLEVAKREKDTIMTDFTYLQHAQPTTFGHYILTFLFPLLRDFDRLRLFYKHLNMSVAGSGSVNGCTFNIDRVYLAKLLSFEGVEYHTRDAMWRSDLPIEIIYILNSIISNIARINDEFQIFCTEEFNIIKLPSSLSRASVIMPNKQNPYVLTYIRGVSNEMLGKIASYISYEKIISGNPDSRTFVYVDLIKNIEKVAQTLSLFSVVLRNMSVNKKVLQERIENSFFYATDIADWLIQHYKIDYEEAHKEVGRVIREMKEKGLKPKDIKPEFFKYHISNLDKLIDPKESIKRKKGIGSVNDIDNIILQAERKIEKFCLKKSDFSFLENELKEYGYDIKFTL
jgi:argininosuccinate lyase